MRSVISCAAISALSLVVAASAAGAGRIGMGGAAQQSPAGVGAAHMTQSKTLAPAHATGQPNQSCETTPNTPGRAVSAPGSAFNPDGHAGTVYAGEQIQNSRNSASVSQYDVACTRR